MDQPEHPGADRHQRSTSRRSLRHRVAVTLATFGAAVSLLLSVAIYLVSHNLEQQLIDDILGAELEDLIERTRRNPVSVPERTATLRAYVTNTAQPRSDIPAAVAALPVGRHQLLLEQKSYRAAVQEQDGRRFVVLLDESASQHRERGFVLLLALSVALTALVAALSGHWLASRVIAPVTELVRRAASLTPGQPHQPLANEFPWHEVHQLAADFDDYLDRLHDFLQRERLFTGDISHELRTPLTVLAGASDLLLANPALDERAHKTVARIARAVTEMSEITAALLALAREQSPEAVQTPASQAQCDAASLVAELVERHRQLLLNKPVTLQLQTLGRPILAADRAVLAMVFGNLLRNAIHFTDAGEVQVRLLDDAIELRDSGSGLGNRNVAELFRPHVRSPSSGGSGLGLSLVKRLCDRHGWRVQLSNQPRGGTLARLEFSARVPL